MLHRSSQEIRASLQSLGIVKGTAWAVRDWQNSLDRIGPYSYTLQIMASGQVLRDGEPVSNKPEELLRLESAVLEGRANQPLTSMVW
jgi:hypothetical protein